jgi:hypothetical protein
MYMEDLEWWFEGWLGDLSHYGYRLAMYTVPEDEIKCGDFTQQVAFPKDKGRRSRVVDIPANIT